MLTADEIFKIGEIERLKSEILVLSDDDWLSRFFQDAGGYRTKWEKLMEKAYKRGLRKCH